MRLIDTTTFRLVRCNPENTPPYAILSHTWGAEHDEVTLQELESLATLPPGHEYANRITSKLGFNKIRGAAGVAREKGLRYIWVDTCCIDKTSSAELSDAINSMYQWYRNATICYAHLSDVNRPRERVLAAVAPELRVSRWFTRGWTLLELLAPKEMEFFAVDWTYLGQKSKPTPFRSLLADVTGIEEHVICGLTPLEDISVAQRMKWASNRNTTRVEDSAYCLMGIFNVNMPLLYGEGSRAFIRLQEEIIKQTDDHSIFAWSLPDSEAQSNQIVGLLAPSPKCFSDSALARPLIAANVGTAPEMTGRGLRVRFKTVTIRNSELAILDCYPIYREPFIGNEAQYEPNYFAIYVKRIGQGQYARVLGHQLELVASSEMQSTTGKTIYVKQNPQYKPPDILLQIPSSESLYDHDIRLKAVAPASRWSQELRLLRSASDTAGAVTGAFLFEITTPSGRKLELVFRCQLGLEPDGKWSGRFDQWVTSKVVAPLDHFYSQPPNMTTNDVMPTKLTPAVHYSYFEKLVPRFGLEAKLEIRHEEHRDIGTIDFTFAHEACSQPLEHMDTLYRSPAVSHVWNREDMRSNIGAAVSKVTHGFRTPDKVELSVFPGPGEHKAWLAITSSKIRTHSASIPSKSPEPRTNSIQILNYLLSTMTHDHLKLIELDGTDFIDQIDHEQIVKTIVFSNALGNQTFIGSGMEQRTLDSLVVWNNNKIKTKGLDGIPGFALPPVFWAVFQGREQLVKQLIDEFDVNLSICSTYGLSLLHILVLGNSQELLRYFLTEYDGKTAAIPFKPDLEQSTLIFGDTAAHFAAAYGQLKSNDTAFNHKSADGEVSAEPWFSTTASPMLSPRAENWLRQAAESWLLIYAALIPNEDSGGFRMVENTAGETPLHRAAAMGNGVALRALLDHVPNVDCADNDGRTPLWHAAAAGALLEAYLLLERGANPDHKDSFGRTPLAAACMVGNHQVVDLLLRYKADPFHETIALGFTALHLAAVFGHSECLRHLLEHEGVTNERWKQNLESSDELEIPPINLAAANGWLECVKLFCTHGWDISVASPYLVLVDHSLDFGSLSIFNRSTATAIETASICGQRTVEQYLVGQCTSDSGVGPATYLSDTEQTRFQVQSRSTYV